MMQPSQTLTREDAPEARARSAEPSLSFAQLAERVQHNSLSRMVTSSTETQSRKDWKVFATPTESWVTSTSLRFLMRI
jgi:hypothetical protein